MDAHFCLKISKYNLYQENFYLKQVSGKVVTSLTEVEIASQDK